ncbi:MAG TPA: hypothetical protein VM733_16765 [Thermoanaerobaculia bacterium]|nr:hypothetical protein [Thermoanaerobaculia bacterium]
MDTAESYFKRAIAKFHEAGHELGPVHIAFDLAEVELQRGNETAAVEMLDQARREFEQLGDLEASARAMLRIAAHLESKGDYAGAAELVAKSRALLPKPPAALAKLIDTFASQLPQRES